MMITRKPVSLLLSALFGLYSLVTLANPTSDSTQVAAQPAHEAYAVTQDSAQAEVAHSETAHEVKHEGAVNEKEEVDAFIEHHLKDSHDFHFFADGEKGEHYGFSLPVILWEDGLHFFSSSKFEEGNGIVESNGKYFRIEHSMIYSCDKDGNIDHEAHTNPLKRPLDLSITKNVLSMLVVAVMLLFMFISLAKSYKKGPIPTGFGRILEPLIIFIRDEVAIPNIGEKKYRKFMGFLLTVFFFIWLLNLLGMTPIGINVTGNIAITICLALFTYIITQFSANKDYWGHIFWMPGVPVPMKIILAPIELLGTLTKPFALLIRLFANITAGHVVIMSLIAMIFVGKNLAADLPISFGLTLFISVIELLVAFLQAFIFTMLSSLFIGMAVQDHHHDDHH